MTHTVGLMKDENFYQPRTYPTDTPVEAICRAEGFEAGRQYEASLRGDTPATVIPAAEFAALFPIVDGDKNDQHCFFCKAHWQKPHAATCLWIRCGGVPA